MKTNKKEQGQAIYLIVFGVMALIGSAALAIDGGRIYLDRREVQNTADSAVLAAALSDCTDNGDLVVKARAIAAANGFDNSDPNVSVNVYNPPISGPYTGDTKYYEVVINTDTEVGLAQLVRPGTFPVEARAVAMCEEGSTGGGAVGDGNGIIALRPTGDDAIYAPGNVRITVLNGGIHSDSSHSQAITATGSSKIVADVVTVVGGYKTTGTATISPTPLTGQSVMGDPLASLVPPENPYTGACTSYTSPSWSTHHIEPGYYCQLKVGGSATVFMAGGTYVIDGGQFKVDGAGSLIADSGITLILINGASFTVTGSGQFGLEDSFVYIESGSVDLSGNVHYTITSKTSGPWAGMAFYLDQSNTSDFKIAGSSSNTAQGTIYAPASSLSIVGNSGDYVLDSQLIVYDVDVTGSSKLTLDYEPGSLFQNPETSEAMISLVE